MNQVNARLFEMTSLSRETYFSEAQEPFFNLQMRVNQELAASPTPATETLLINGLSSVDIDRHQDLPALLLRYASGLRNWKVSTGLNFYLIAQNLDTGALKIQSLAEKGEERTATPPPSASGQPPDSNTAESTGTSLRRYFLRQLLKIDWQPSRLALTVIDYDASSNTLPVTLTKANFLPPKSALPVVRPSEFLKSLPTPSAKAPGPDDIGLSVAINNKDQTVIQGQIRAAVANVPAARSSAGGEHADVILATLLLVALDQRPLPVDLAIPAALHGAPGTQRQLSGEFRFDLVPLLGKQRKAGVYQVYLLAGAQTFGPLAVRVGG